MGDGEAGSILIPVVPQGRGGTAGRNTVRAGVRYGAGEAPHHTSTVRSATDLWGKYQAIKKHRSIKCDDS